MKTNIPRRTFAGATITALAGLGGGFRFATGAEKETRARQAATSVAGGTPRRIGAVAYSFQYSIGLFSYRQRLGERFDAVQFVEATHAAGGNVAQLFRLMIDSLSDDELRRLRHRAEQLDVLLEVHGGHAPRNEFEHTMRQAAKLGCRIVGGTFGFMLRPDKLATLADWDRHYVACEKRVAELVPIARSLRLTLAVENHLDFTLQELHTLVRRFESAEVGLVFDTGNWIGTLDDPLEAADTLGPYVAATHYKDFAIEETPQGFRFTMVPLGCGSLRLEELTRRLQRQVRPEVAFSIEMMNGQHFDVNWLEDRFWTPFRNKTARQVAAVLRHIRSRAIDPKEHIPVEEFDKLPHEAHLKLEADRIARCIAHLRELVADVG